MALHKAASLCRLLIFLLIVPCCDLNAQLQEHVYMNSTAIDTTKTGSLYAELDNISFFRDNEYDGSYIKGYTLPGLWIQPKVTYNPLPNIHLEAGLHMLIYEGADKYPCFSYQDIALWKADQYQKGTHILPFFRAQMALNKHVDVILGDIYGGSNHQLIDPLFNSEINLTADPEAGLQLLLNTKPLTLDAWVNWQSFIFQNDYHKEVFTVGLSSRLRINDEKAPFHVYFPIQTLIQHRGGEIDTILTKSIQTLMNGSIGAGVVWNFNKKNNVRLEGDYVGYYQQAGELLPHDKGWGLYLRATADISHFRFKTAYWQSNRFLTLFGNQHFSSMTTEQNSYKCRTYDHPTVVYAGLEYALKFGKGYSFGIDCDLFHHLSCDRTNPDGTVEREKTSDSFTAGIYFRINPTFLIKKFK